MRVTQLNSILRRRPFRPFRITLSTRETFDITHPEMVVASEHFIAIAMRRPIGTEDDEVLMYWVDINHLVQVCRL